MTRTQPSTLLALFSVLSFAPAALAHDDGSALRPEDAPADAAGDEAEAEEDTAQDVADEGDYCGGDEDYPLMDAEGYLEGREWKPLYREVGALLREGRAGWQRAEALSYLATAELHMGRARPAARNFLLAFATDPDVAPGLRAELAIALLQNRQHEAAFEQASTFVSQWCVAPETWMQASCWAARTVMSRATDDASVREEQLRAAEAVRPHTDDSLAQVLELEELMGDAAPTATRVASR